jgi:very-short-patch-repair endonuclease
VHISEDMERQSVLERMGCIFTRIRSSEFLRNPARAMKPVLEKLQMLEIPRGRDTTGVGPT